MDNTIKPPDTGSRDPSTRRKRKRLVQKWVRRILRNRQMLLAVIGLAKALLKLLGDSDMDGS